MEQLQIPAEFFVPVEQLAQEAAKHAVRVDSRLSHLCRWLIVTHRCDPSIKGYVERLCREFDRIDVENRVKALIALCTTDGWGLEDAEYVGVFDHAITDYHVLWDRAWAIRMLVPRELVPKVRKCGYGGSPKFWDREGNLLFQSIYSKDGRVLTPEERRQALKEAGVL